ncbi:conserved hypothetical protein [Streptomyces misionensis JCM 4497]
MLVHRARLRRPAARPVSGPARRLADPGRPGRRHHAGAGRLPAPRGLSAGRSAADRRPRRVSRSDGCDS